MRRDTRQFTLFLIICTFTLAGVSCGLFGKTESGLGVFEEDDTDEAIELINEANRNLKSIRVLYKKSGTKFAALKIAISKREVENVRKLAEDLSLMINDGYVFAESAKEKIEKAQTLDINPDWKDYLSLKESSLEMQIKAFGFRSESAKLFKYKSTGKSKLEMGQAKAAFDKNEDSFAKYMAEANKLNKEADELAKTADKKKKG